MEEDKERIQELEGEIIELKAQLKQSKDKELVYKDMLYNIEVAIKNVFKSEEENIRYNLGVKINFRDCIVNLKNAMDEYRRLYGLRF
jgi:hypothetical protein